MCRYKTTDGKCKKTSSRLMCDGTLYAPGEEQYRPKFNMITPEQVCEAASPFGNDYITITREMLEHLENGGILSCVDEYGIFIKLEKE